MPDPPLVVVPPVAAVVLVTACRVRDADGTTVDDACVLALALDDECDVRADDEGRALRVAPAVLLGTALLVGAGA